VGEQKPILLTYPGEGEERLVEVRRANGTGGPIPGVRQKGEKTMGLSKANQSGGSQINITTFPAKKKPECILKWSNYVAKYKR